MTTPQPKLFALFCCVCAWLCLPAFARIPSPLEPDFAEATLTFRDRQYEKTLSILDALLAKEPGLGEFLEMKALTLRMKGDLRGASEIYSSLLEKADERNLTAEQRAPYHFEQGLILSSGEKWKEAIPQFDASHASGFNRDACRYLASLSHFKLGNLDVAQAGFEEVAGSPVKELASQSNFFLATIAEARGDGTSFLRNLYQARMAAQESLDDAKRAGAKNTNAETLIQRANETLKNYSSPRFFGNVGLLTSYDSNVFAAPSVGSSITDPASGISTLRQILVAGLGYATSNLDAVQWVPNYRGSVNYNFAPGSHTGQFVTHDISLFINRAPLAVTSYGMKLEAVYLFKLAGSDNTNAGKFSPYVISGIFAPYLKHEFSPTWMLSTDLHVQVDRFFLDNTTSQTLRRSGTEEVLKIGIGQERGAFLFNPSFSVSGALNQTKGEEFRSRTVALALANTAHLTGATSMTIQTGFATSSFTSRPGSPRSDRSVNARLSLVNTPLKSLQLLADVQYILNSSNVPEYDYKRWLMTGGANYSF